MNAETDPTPAAPMAPRKFQIDLGHFELFQHGFWVGVMSVPNGREEHYFLFTSSGTGRTSGRAFRPYVWPGANAPNVITTFKYLGSAPPIAGTRTALDNDGVRRDYVRTTTDPPVHE